MIKNKILALVCAMSMIGTMFATVANAANPDVKFTLTVQEYVDEEGNDITLDDNIDEDLEYEDFYGAPMYKLTLAVSGLAKKASVKENGTTVAYTGTLLNSLGAFIDFDASKFTYVKGESSFGGTFVPGKVASADQLSITWYDTSAHKEDGEIGTLYLFATEGEKIEDEVAFTLNGEKTYAYLTYWDGTSKEAILDGSNKSTTVADGLSFVNAKLNEVLTQKYNVSVGTVENGIVTLDATGEVEENTTVNVTATADEGYELEGIYVNDAKIDGTSFVVTADSVVTAKFTKLIVPATATYVEQKQEGTVYGLKGEIAANGQTVTGVAFKVNNGEKDGNVNATFKQAIAVGSNVTFGVNIIGIPSEITLGYVADSLAPVAE